MTGDVTIPDEGWAARIAACWRQSAEAIIATGRLIAEAKEAMEYGEFTAMVEQALPFTARTAQMLMAIAADPRLTNPKRVSLLPPSWGAMYELTRLKDEDLDRGFAEGVIKPDIERNEIAAIRKDAARAPERKAYEERLAAGCSVQDLNDLIEAGTTFATILADPPWSFEAYSDKGLDRSPGYDTKRIEGIKALPVKQLAAKDCTLHIWVLMNQLPEALDVIAAWGFTYKTCGFSWMKQNKSGNGLFMGMGYWTRANTEICLLATKGSPRRFDYGVPQALLAPVMEHSRKPDEFHARIERLTEGPYLELYARRTRDNWTTWGNEIPRATFRAPIDAAGNVLAHDESGEVIESNRKNAPAPAPAEVLPEPIEGIPDFLRRDSPSVSVASASSPTPNAAG